MQVIEQKVTDDAVITTVQKQDATTLVESTSVEPTAVKSTVVESVESAPSAAQPDTGDVTQGAGMAEGASEEAAASTGPSRRLLDRRSIPRRFYEAEVLLKIAANDAEIMACLQATKYDLTTLAEGRIRYEEAMTLHRAVHRLQAEREEATDRFQAAWRTARYAYSRDLRTARRLLWDNRNAVRALQLAGKRKQSFGTWVDQAREFYDHLLGTPTFIEVVALSGLTEGVLLDHQLLIEAAHLAMQVRLQLMGDAKQRRRERDGALTALERWVSTFRSTLEDALRAKPALLSKVMVPEPTTVPPLSTDGPAEVPTETPASGPPVLHAA